MQSVPDEDRTARARIRDAALARFAENGMDGTSLKTVAEDAGVSQALVFYHFGSKDALREACDTYVIQAFGGLDRFGWDSGEITKPDFMEQLFTQSSPVIRYIARAMVEDSEVASALFDTNAGVAEEFLVDIAPERFPAGSVKACDAAAVMTAMHMATVVLHEHLSRRMGEDVLTPKNSPRIGMALFDIYAVMGEFVASSVGEGIRSAVDSQQMHNAESSPSSTNGGHDE
ncbi:TetR/AcrR family transcriptional regulator [Actinopolyspora erythraea]|uniref:TetR/AcrR family transcriptional regulator n=1 Tax=Actinopolyspora erythraea TaxID=414996 RepID=A0A223RS62_9ACTN|nr:helix-turn-helix domain-containing protein [Actinopolyspora erythraea]ASU78687.1 TetR/AcrR family transcriptional regulator [Actinopolyspora erythraea]